MAKDVGLEEKIRRNRGAEFLGDGKVDGGGHLRRGGEGDVGGVFAKKDARGQLAGQPSVAAGAGAHG